MPRAFGSLPMMICGCIGVSSETSTHSRHLRVRPDTAVTVHAAVDDPRLIHGLQMHGRAAAVPVADRDVVQNLYIERFPFAADPPYRDALDRQRFYRFTPTWLRWIDNRRGFGFAVEENIDTDQGD